jgi:hypothetical protein
MDLTVKKQVTNAHNLTTTVTSNWQAPPDQLIGLEATNTGEGILGAM